MTKRMMIAGLLVAFLSVGTQVFADDVFTTKRGKKYHKAICRLIKNKETITKHEKDDAIELSYAPCRRCFKEDIITDEHPQEEKQVIEEKK